MEWTSALPAAAVAENVSRYGFVNTWVDPTLDLEAEIRRLKREKNAVVLAHYYQDSEIQDLADYVGDSLGLARKAAGTDADLILFAGVHFMAETAKILNPTKKVILPDVNAGCSLSDSCPAEVFEAFKARHPDHLVVSYINCSAALKALSDVIVTSSSAVDIVNSFPADQPLIFAPDRNLGAYVNKVTGRNMVLWNGACMVHEIFSRRKIEQLLAEHPEAELVAHPECEEAVLELATFIGSTTALLQYVATSPGRQFIVATEPGILHRMRQEAPGKELIMAPSNQTCACNNCPHMKLNTLEKVYLCLLHEAPELTLPPELITRALRPIQRMLELSKK
jgi:quinolinate synthase